tara:strand:- start:4505 stop:5566 length:1062 start_codon:yes stop_codon:yes gene_type:complete
MKLICGDSTEELRNLEPCSIDAVVCDPPYGLGSTTPSQVSSCLQAWSRGETWKPQGSGFMGKSWDSWVPPPELWKEVIRVLKPGGHLIAFAGSRTQDLMSISLRLAGFEVRDTIQWLYGSGFPKSLNIGKAIDKIQSQEAKQYEGYGTALKPAFEPAILCRKPLDGTVAHNVLKHGVGGLNIDGCRIGDEVIKTEGYTNSQPLVSFQDVNPFYQGMSHVGRWPSNVIMDEQVECGEWKRFFYCAKASRQEREQGLDGHGSRVNIHPTVKPIDLMRYLCRLITPRNGIILDPFLGSGSTGIAAGLEGFDFVGIEREEEYFEIAKTRIEHWTNTTLTYDQPQPKEVKTGEQLSLF